MLHSQNLLHHFSFFSLPITHTHTHKNTHTHTHKNTHTHTHTKTHIHTYTHTHTKTHIHTQKHTYTHTHTSLACVVDAKQPLFHEVDDAIANFRIKLAGKDGVPATLLGLGGGYYPGWQKKKRDRKQ